jgi:PAS domain S-box-containing protein
MHVPNKDKKHNSTRKDDLCLNESKLCEILLEKAPFAAFIFKDNRTCCYVNYAAEVLTGYTKAELFHLTYKDIVHPDFQELFRTQGHLPKPGTATSPRYEIKIITKSGKERWIELNTTAVSLDGANGVFLTAIDIGERKSFEEMLKLTQFSVDASVDAIFWITPDGKMYKVNKAACLELGYTHDELLKLYVWDIDPLFSREKWLEEWEYVKKNKSHKFETLHKNKNGKKIAVEIQANYLRYDDSEYSCAFSRDITERKRIEEYLNITQLAMDKFGDPIIWLSSEGRLVYVNEAACKSMGYSKEKLLTMYVWDIDPNFPPERYLENWRDEYRRRQFLKFETIHIASDGRRFPVEATASYIKYEDKEFLITFDRDITERKQVEETLRESEEKFRVLADTSAAAIFIYDGYKFVSVNHGTEKLTGYSRDELFNMGYLDFVHPDFRELVRDRSQRRIKGEDVPSRYELKIVTKNGEERWVELTAGRIMYQRKPAGVATLFDITDRKRAEEALSEAKDQAELYLDLMGHDINNFNQIALGYLELANDLIASDARLGGDNKELIDKPIAALQNSSKLIENVRKLQKMRAKGLRLSRVDICSVILKLKEYYTHFSRRDITINYIPPDECQVVANDLIDEIFSNLIENSIKHSRPDRPLVIDIVQSEVCEEGREYDRVSVEDNGPGIPDVMKEKLFTRYYRGQTMTRGKGLGLYLVKTLVDDFNGKVWVEDRVPGDYAKGAKFVVMIPV